MRFPLAILAALVAAYSLGFFLAVPANPEVRFWQEVVERRHREIAQVRKSSPNEPVIFFTGGSSTAFSIDPKIIEEICGLPAFNLGLPVAAGGEYLIHQALSQTRPGDTLVLCLEPDLLGASNPETSPSKFSFAMAAGSGRINDAAGGDSFNSTLSGRDTLNLTRPGASYLATLMARVVSRKSYRYKLSDIRYRGRIETPVSGASPAEMRSTSSLSPYGKDLLNQASNAAKSRKVHLFYAIPWHFTTTSGVAQSRDNQKQLSDQIHSIIPTVDDGFTGVADDPAWFSDSAQHLTAAGSALRSKHLASALVNQLR